MNILGIDTTGRSVGVAVCRDEEILSEIFVRNGLTHSATLMPYIEQALMMAGMEKNQLDRIGVAVGPGSFTGVRIGVCTAKAFSQGLGKPLAAINALDGLAQNAADFEGVICPIMDARRGQVYTAAYKNGEKILEDHALDIEQWIGMIPKNEPVLFLGDGVPVLKDRIKDLFPDARFANEQILYQRGTSICILAKGAQEESYKELMPYYLRPSQAERLKK